MSESDRQHVPPAAASGRRHLAGLVLPVFLALSAGLVPAALLSAGGGPIHWPALVALALALGIASAIALRSYIRRATLSARIAEEAARREEAARANEQLQEQIRRRDRAEQRHRRAGEELRRRNEELRQARGDLSELNETLERRVQERTTKLEKALADLQNAQSTLIHTEKLASIGQLASGIAHEINTPVQYLGDNMRFLDECLLDLLALADGQGELLRAAERAEFAPEATRRVRDALDEVDLDYLRREAPEALRQSHEGIERVSTIIRAMKDFSGPAVQEKCLHDINQAIDSTLTVARNEWKYVAELVRQYDPELPAVPCLLADFNQVVLNLVLNAAAAIRDTVGEDPDDKGTITVSTRRDGGWAEIRIADTGPGIPEEIRRRVFEPFFTTRDVGEGTGQGLAVAYAVVVEKHGGTLTFETEVNEGTTFIIRLPLAEDGAQQADPPDQSLAADPPGMPDRGDRSERVSSADG